jgi:hypothetical protein
MLRVALVVIVLIAAILVIAAFRPDTFTIQRSRSIQAPFRSGRVLAARARAG